MPSSLVDVCRFNPTLGGTTDWVYSTAVVGYQSPAAAGAADGAVYSLRSESLDLSQWEISVGAFNASTGTFARTIILANSLGTTAKINFTVPPQVAIVALAEDLLSFNSAMSLTTAQKQQVQSNIGTRTVLAANRTYFVRTAGAVVSFPGTNTTVNTISSIDVAWTAHGLSVGDPFVASITPNSTSCTISNANPGVVTMANTFAAGQPIRFRSSGYLPSTLTDNTTYYVLAAGLSGSSFQIAATPGGAAINTSKLTLTASSGTGGALLITASAAHNLSVGQIVAFANSGGALPTNLTASTQFYVAASPAPTSTAFYVALTNGGTNVLFSAAGSGTNTLEQAGGTTSTLYGSAATYLCECTGAFPTLTAGTLTEGTTYFVANVKDANTINLSTAFPATSGNMVAAFSAAATGAPIYNGVTGNDANNGLAQTRSGAFLSVQAAINAALSIDLGVFTVTIQLGDSRHVGSNSIASATVGGGSSTGRNIVFNGNATFPGNVIVDGAAAHSFAASVQGCIGIQNLEVANGSASGGNLSATNGGKIFMSNIRFGLTTAWHLQSDQGSVIGMYFFGLAVAFMSHGGDRFMEAGNAGYLDFGGATITLYGNPSFTYFGTWGGAGFGRFQSVTIVGNGTGTRFLIGSNAVVSTIGQPVTLLPGNIAGSSSTGGIYS